MTNGLFHLRSRRAYAAAARYRTDGCSLPLNTRRHAALKAILPYSGRHGRYRRIAGILLSHHLAHAFEGFGT